jgi:hypothetical protein
VYRSVRWIAALTVAVLTFAGSNTVLAASAGPPGVVIGGEGSPSAIPDSYVVKFKDTASLRRHGIGERAQVLATRHRATLGQVWQRALPGFAATMSRADATRLAAEGEVESVVQDQFLATGDIPGRGSPVAPAFTQTPVTWGLDRIDQKALPLDNHYSYDDSAGQGVRAYILATGILASHPEFAGRVIGGGNFINDGRTSTSDCHGAGTRIAGIVGGTQFGVAKNVSLVSVRTSNCQNLTSLSAIVGGFEWVLNNAVLPAIVLFFVLDYCVDPQNGNPLPCAPDVAETVVGIQVAAFAGGLPVFGMAGDSAQDTCANATGAAPDTVYVGASTIADSRASYANFGPCVTMYAPGDGITTADPAGTTVVSSSAAGAAYVAGAAALFAGKPEFEGASPAEIRDELVQNRSTPNVLSGLSGNTPNRLLFTGPPGFFTIGDSASLVPTGSGVELFGANTGGRLQYRQRPTAGGWSPWTHSVTKGWLSVNAEPNADGRLALLGLTPSGEIWLREETTASSNTWSNWAKLSAVPSSVPVARVSMAHNRSNRLQIFATTHQGQAYYRSQLAAGSRLWSAWTAFSFSGRLRAITSASYADGRVEVLAIDDAGQVWKTTQLTATDTTWSAFSKLSGFGMASVSASRNANGKLELFGVDAGGGVWRRTQPTVGTWGGWTAMPPKTLSRITSETGPDGRIQVVGVDNLGVVWHSTQTAPSAGTFSAWSALDGTLRP